MANKKKTVGRPKKTFVSKKPKTKIKSWPGRPRKEQKAHGSANHVSPVVAWFVAKSVDESKKKDFIILLLFLLSFVLFIISLYFTFMRDKATTLTSWEIAEIANIETWNIDYTSSTPAQEQEISPTPQTIQPTIQNLTTQQQTIMDFYQAVNSIDTATIYKLTDARLEQSNVFKTYYSRNRLSKFSETILSPKIVVTNIQELATTSDNPNIKNFTYTLEYMLANTQQKFTEERSTVLIKKGDDRRIGKLMCETKGCSTMPFFNTEKYKNN